MIRLVLCDIDDTLLPSTETFWAAVQEVLDLRYGEQAAALTEQVLRLVYYFGTTEYRGFWLALCAERGLPLAEREREHEALTQAYKEAYGRRIAARAGARETLQRLRAEGRTLGVISNGRTPFQQMKLERSNLLDLFDGPVLVSGDFHEGAAKPSPHLFQEALRRTGIEASETVFLGDRTADVIGGNLAGLWVVRYDAPEQAPAPATLRTAQPHATIRRMDELHDVLRILDPKVG